MVKAVDGSPPTGSDRSGERPRTGAPHALPPRTVGGPRHRRPTDDRRRRGARPVWTRSTRAARSSARADSDLGDRGRARVLRRLEEGAEPSAIRLGTLRVHPGAERERLGPELLPPPSGQLDDRILVDGRVGRGAPALRELLGEQGEVVLVAQERREPVRLVGLRLEERWPGLLEELRVVPEVLHALAPPVEVLRRRIAERPLTRPLAARVGAGGAVTEHGVVDPCERPIGDRGGRRLEPLRRGADVARGGALPGGPRPRAERALERGEGRLRDLSREPRGE